MCLFFAFTRASWQPKLQCEMSHEWTPLGCQYYTKKKSRIDETLISFYSFLSHWQFNWEHTGEEETHNHTHNLCITIACRLKGGMREEQRRHLSWETFPQCEGERETYLVRDRKGVNVEWRRGEHYKSSLYPPPSNALNVNFENHVIVKARKGA